LLILCANVVQPQCPDVRSNIILGVYVKIFLDDFII
jgi:hypothetical protein